MIGKVAADKDGPYHKSAGLFESSGEEAPINIDLVI